MTLIADYVPEHSYVPDDPHYETDEHDTCWFEWDWPLQSGGVSRTRCRSPFYMHVARGWDDANRFDTQEVPS